MSHQPYKWFPANSDRTITVTTSPSSGYATTLPHIRIAGRWVAAAGFRIGAKVRITATLNEIRITNVESVRSVVFKHHGYSVCTPIYRLRRTTTPTKPSPRQRPATRKAQRPSSKSPSLRILPATSPAHAVSRR